MGTTRFIAVSTTPQEAALHRFDDGIEAGAVEFAGSILTNRFQMLTIGHIHLADHLQGLGCIGTVEIATHQLVMGITAIATVSREVRQSAGETPVCQIRSEGQHSTGMLTESVDDENLGMNLSGSGCQSPVGNRVNAVLQMVLASACSGFHRSGSLSAGCHGQGSPCHAPKLPRGRKK